MQRLWERLETTPSFAPPIAASAAGIVAGMRNVAASILRWCSLRSTTGQWLEFFQDMKPKTP